jgi:hypothetical protein
MLDSSFGPAIHQSPTKPLSYPSPIEDISDRHSDPETPIPSHNPSNILGQNQQYILPENDDQFEDTQRQDDSPKQDQYSQDLEGDPEGDLEIEVEGEVEGEVNGYVEG